MDFSAVLGLNFIKKHLQQSADTGRIPHAQLFVGAEGSGTLPMALAYAQYLLCKDSIDVESSKLKCSKLSHPDLHFAFPVATNDKIKKDPISNLFLADWRSFIAQNPYGNLFDWLQFIGIENKQGAINVDEAEQIVKSLKLKSYEGGYKVMIIWMAEKLHTSAANKLLKLIEEPPAKTVFILIAENEEQIISTIRSRCQVLHFPVLSENDVVQGLVSREKITEIEAFNIAQQANGNFNKALNILHNNSNDLLFEQWFITWVRSAFKAKGDASAIAHLVEWSDNIAGVGRETQKHFLQYCLQFFRQALLQNYALSELVYLQPQTENFKFDGFSKFIHSGNILAITQEIEEAIFHVERNGNPKIIFLDLSIKLTRLLHQKES
ncbi:MAG: DNA polymerase III subunit delta' [Flavobacteriaceae bacterium]|jgi:DNA polymerase-3 subunit delta'|nr:DNA polymerase III subunit delta' [Flavobacteriaceae bacterium]